MFQNNSQATAHRSDQGAIPPRRDRAIAAPAASRRALLSAISGLAALGLVACQSTPTADDRPDGAGAAEAPAPPEEAAGDDALAQDAEDFATRIGERLGDDPPQSSAGPDPTGDVHWAPTLRAPAERIDPRLPAGQPNLVAAPPDEADAPPDQAPEQTADAEADADAADTVPRSPAPPIRSSALAAQLAQRLRTEARDAAREGPPHDDAAGPHAHYLAAAGLAVLDPRLALSEADLADLAAEDRRALLAYQRFFTGLAEPAEDGAGAGSERLGLAADRLARRLADLRPMRVRNAHLCKRVNGFGVYTPFESSAFLAGREHPVIVYAEVEDFATDLGSDGQHAVRLTQEVVLHNDSDGLAVWRVQPAEITDRSHNRRRDFFIVQVVRLPARLTVGKYTLKVTVTDEVGHAVDEAALPLRIVADANLARRGGD